MIGLCWSVTVQHCRRAIVHLLLWTSDSIYLVDYGSIGVQEWPSHSKVGVHVAKGGTWENLSPGPRVSTAIQIQMPLLPGRAPEQ